MAGVNLLLKSNHPTAPPAVTTTILSMKLVDQVGLSPPLEFWDVKC